MSEIFIATESDGSQWVSLEDYNAAIQKINNLETSTYCAYCGEKCELDDNAATRISEHIKVCEKHPIHNYKNMIERLVNALEFWSSLEDYVPGEWEHEERKELIDKASKLVGMVI